MISGRRKRKCLLKVSDCGTAKGVGNKRCITVVWHIVVWSLDYGSLAHQHGGDDSENAPPLVGRRVRRDAVHDERNDHHRGRDDDREEPGHEVAAEYSNLNLAPKIHEKWLSCRNFDRRTFFEIQLYSASNE